MDRRSGRGDGGATAHPVAGVGAGHSSRDPTEVSNTPKIFYKPPVAETVEPASYPRAGEARLVERDLGEEGVEWFPLKSGVFFSQTYSDLFGLIRTLFTSTRLFASTAQNNLFRIIFTYYSSTYSCYSLEAE